MKRCVLYSVLILFAFMGTANAITYDFESLPEGTYSESEFSNLFNGVSFNNNGGGFEIFKSDLGSHVDDSYGGLRRDVSRFQPYLSTIATFDNLTDYVGITRLARNPHTVWFFLRAYDADHNLLSQVEQIYWPSDPFHPLASHTLEFKSDLANIAFVEFWSDDGNYTQGDGFWDDFSFSRSPIPEPTTLMLLGAGLFGLAGNSYRKLKK